MNLNSSTHEQSEKSDSRQGAKRAGRQRRYGTTTDGHEWTRRGIAATKEEKTTTDYTDFTD